MIPDLKLVEKHGGKRLRRIVEHFMAHKAVFPLLGRHIIHWRNVGPFAIQQLSELGIVDPDPFSGLSTRAANILDNLSIQTKDKVIDLIKSGQLTPDKRSTYKTRNYGWKTHKEICAWAGLPDPERLIPLMGYNTLKWWRLKYGEIPEYSGIVSEIDKLKL